MCKQLYTGFRFTNQDMVWTVTMTANAHVLPHIHPVYFSMLVNVKNIYIPSYLYICINDQKKKNMASMCAAPGVWLSTKHYCDDSAFSEKKLTFFFRLMNSQSVFQHPWGGNRDLWVQI